MNSGITDTKKTTTVSMPTTHTISSKQMTTMGPLMNFTFAGLSGMGATAVVQPLNLIKNRMQLQQSSLSNSSKLNTIQMIMNTMKNEGGIRALYRGLSAGLFRQATYTTTRLGVYSSLIEYSTRNNEYDDGNSSISFYQKVMIGMLAGGIGAFLGTPAEVALVRMTADGRLPIHQRRHYRHVFNALMRIIREEGLWTLWRGCGPTIMRAMILNAAQLATYSQSKQLLIDSGHFHDNLYCHTVASMFSGLAATIVSMPVDIAKTRLQQMSKLHGMMEYRGTMDCLIKIIHNEGVFSLWKGFLPYFLRLGPHTVLTFIILEQLNSLYKKIQH